MAKYKFSLVAQEDLIRIHHYGVHRFGMKQADLYFDSFFLYFDLIAKQPYAFESVGYIRPGYRRCVCGSDTIYYRINEGLVEIMTIIGRQDLANIP